MIFIFFGSLLILQLFVSVIIDMYITQKGVLSHDQQEFEHLERMVGFLSPDELPKRPKNNCFRKLCYDICVPWDRGHESASSSEQGLGGDAVHYRRLAKFVPLRWIRNHFNDVTVCVVTLNFLLLCTRHDDMSSEWSSILETGDIIFVCLYCTELLIRLTAFTPTIYLKNAWNAVDTVVIVISVLAIVVGGKAARATRVLRVLRLLKCVLYFNMITTVMLESLVQIWHVLSTLFLIMFAWAVFGIEVFGSTRYGTHLDKHSNFEDFSSAVYTLNRVMFGEWGYLRRDCRIQPPLCTEGKDCGSDYKSKLTGFVDATSPLKLSGRGWSPSSIGSSTSGEDRCAFSLDFSPE